MSIMNISFPEIEQLFDQSIAIEAQSEVDDGAGGETTSWTIESVVDGRVSPLNGKELYEMQNINPEINSKIFLKKGSVITEQNKIRLLSDDELIVNGNMDLDSNWSGYQTPAVNEQSDVESHSLTYSRHFEPDGAAEGIRSDNFTTENKKYLVSFWVKTNSIYAGLLIRNGAGSEWALSKGYTNIIPNVWNFISEEYTEIAEGSGAYLIVYSSGNASSGHWYIDDVSIKELTSTKSYDVLFVKNPVSANEFLIAYTKSMDK